MKIKSPFITQKILQIECQQIDLPNTVYRSVTEEEKIIALANNIRKNGLLVPLLLRRNINDPKRYLLVSGFRRLCALSYLKVKKVPALLLSLTDVEAELARFCLDEMREPFTCYETAVAVNCLLKKGKMTLFVLAEQCGVSTKKIVKKLDILKLTPVERQVVIHHSFSTDFIFLFLQLSLEKRKEALNDIVLKRLSPEQAVLYVKEILTPKKEPTKTTFLADDLLVLNSLKRMAETLEKNGIPARFVKREEKEETAYTLVLKNQKKISFE